MISTIIVSIILLAIVSAIVIHLVKVLADVDATAAECQNIVIRIEFNV